jgi:N-acetylmuramoyl-L-alanine amidase
MPIRHQVSSGDCIASIAFDHGFFPDTIWDDPANRDLRERRRDPNILLEGDVVEVRDLRRKDEPGETERRHRFRRKGVPEILRIVIEDEQGEPRAHLPYRLEIDGSVRRGRTDAEGMLREPIIPGARDGRLFVGEQGAEEEYPLDLGWLDPVTELRGVQQRLKNLGYDCVVDGQPGAQTEQAIRQFQTNHELAPTGEADEATRQALETEHGS